jgi:hypothetical protein
MLSEDLPEVGHRALSAGFDSPSLRNLAGLNAAQHDEARDCFHRALDELCVTRPTRQDAVMRLAREVAQSIVAGSVSAHEGAVRIFELSILADEVDVSLHTFVYAVSEWDDRPDDRHLFEAGIQAAARMLVGPSGT